MKENLKFIFETGCGGDLNVPSGSILSPGFPGKYPADTICYWKITTDIGKLIEITIHEMDMESSVNCIFDGVYISNTRDFENHTLGIFCEKITTPKVLTSNTHVVYIKFLSDFNRPSTGFHATYKTLDSSMIKIVKL